MCEAATLIGLAAAAGTKAYEADRERHQRNEANRLRIRNEEAERRAALASRQIAAQEIHIQQGAEAEQAAVQIEQGRRQVSAAKATAQTTAGEAGAFGANYEALISEFSLQQSEYEYAIERNLAIANQQASLAGRNADLNTRNRIRNSQRLPVPSINVGNYALSGAATGFQIGNSIRPIL